MSWTAIFIYMLIFIVFFIPFLLARRTWHHSGIVDGLIFVLGLSSIYCYTYFLNFDYHLMSSILMIMVIFWFRNPLQIVKGFFLISVVSLITTVLTFTVFFELWISGNLERSFILLGLTATLLCIEMLFTPVQRLFELNPISATQICTFLVPTTITFQLFLDPSNNLIITTLFVLTTLFSFIILGYGLFQSLLLKKHAVRHQILYNTLLEDFSNLMESEQLSRDAIIASLTDDAQLITPSLRGEIQHLLSKQMMTSYSPNPYVNLVAYGLVKTYSNLHISLYSPLSEKHIPLFCTWLELVSELLLDYWCGCYLSITENPLVPGQVTLRIEGTKATAKQMVQLTHPKFLHFVTFKQYPFWGVFLTLIYLNAELKLFGRLHIGEQVEIVFERSC